MHKKNWMVVIFTIAILLLLGNINLETNLKTYKMNEKSNIPIVNAIPNNPPNITSVFPLDGATDISTDGTPIRAEISDLDGDNITVEIWSDHTGPMTQYAGYNLQPVNISNHFYLDGNDDGNWDNNELFTYYFVNNGWNRNGAYGFYNNDPITQNWGMTDHGTIYSYEIRVSDGIDVTIENYNFKTETINIYVDDDYNESTDGWEYDHFDNIQDAINAASESIVYVYNGIYYENIVIDKSIDIIGEDKDNTVIDGQGNDVITLQNNWINISGFNITKGNVGIKNNQYENSTIFNNNICNNLEGIIFGSECNNNSIYHNNFCNNANNNAIDAGSDNWDDGTEGNYWDDFDDPSESAWDNDSDRIADSAYNITGANNKDNYPLVCIDGWYNDPPVAHFSISPDPGYREEDITFDASSSYDPDGSIVTYEWDFGNGHCDDLTSEITTCTYIDIGEFSITLTVWDNVGLCDIFTDTITINDQSSDDDDDITSDDDDDITSDDDDDTEEEEDEPLLTVTNTAPKSDAKGPYYELEDTEITFDGTGCSDPDGDSLSYYWNFGDENWGSGVKPIHSYKIPGNYTVTLTVKDNGGLTDTDTTYALISDKPNFSPQKPKINGIKKGDKNIEYNFTAIATDPDNDSIKYIFYWGDKTNNTSSIFLPHNESFNTSHNWTLPGIYKVNVSAIDENNASSGNMTYIVSIDAFYAGDIGYFIDNENDEIYDTFINNLTGTEDRFEFKDGKYLINNDDDEDWDYTYDPLEGKLTPRSKQTSSDENDNTIIYIAIGGILIIPILLFLILFFFKRDFINKIIKPKEQDKQKKKTKKDKVKKKNKKTKNTKKPKVKEEEKEKILDELKKRFK